MEAYIFKTVFLVLYQLSIVCIFSNQMNCICQLDALKHWSSINLGVNKLCVLFSIDHTGYQHVKHIVHFSVQKHMNETMQGQCHWTGHWKHSMPEYR